MKLRNRKSHVTSLPEGEAPVSRGSRVTKWVYYLLLAGVVGYAGWQLLDYILYVEVRGQIEIEKTRVSPARSGIVEHMGVLEGQRVAKGDLMARIAPEDACTEAPDQKLVKLAFERDLNRRRLALKEQEIRAKDRRYAALDMRRALELDANLRREAEDLRQELADLRDDAALLASEIELQEASLAELRAARDMVPEACRPLAVVAPFDGRVTAVLHRSHEYVRRGEPVFLLTPRRGTVRVEAYPQRDDTERWQPGTVVEVLLPDGGRTLGRVEELHSAAYESIAREKEDYVPVEAHPRVHVRPPDGQTAERWRQFDRMEVFVRQQR